ncbi:MAG: hypothetical protein ACRDIU_02890, partial [Actinomycetota bacterium]
MKVQHLRCVGRTDIRLCTVEAIKAVIAAASQAVMAEEWFTRWNEYRNAGASSRSDPTPPIELPATIGCDPKMTTGFALPMAPAPVKKTCP